MTSASDSPASALAPRIELVGPEPTVSTGYLSASSTAISVPSFWVRKLSTSRPASASVLRNPATTRFATVRSEALRIVAFSRSRSPSDPTV